MFTRSFSSNNQIEHHFSAMKKALVEIHTGQQRRMYSSSERQAQECFS